MAKQPTKCDVCGGSTDGTPSGIKKHNATAKHALAARLADKAGTPVKQSSLPVTDPARYAVPEADGINAPKISPLRDVVDAAAQAVGTALQQGATTEQAQAKAAEIVAARTDFYAVTDLMTDLAALITKREDDLRRRQASLKWVQNNNPTDADRYAEAKVDPILRELRTLRQALNLLNITGIGN